MAELVLAADGRPLKASLNRALRRQKIRALMLIAPLLFCQFLCVLLLPHNHITLFLLLFALLLVLLHLGPFGFRLRFVISLHEFARCAHDIENAFPFVSTLYNT